MSSSFHKTKPSKRRSSGGMPDDSDIPSLSPPGRKTNVKQEDAALEFDQHVTDTFPTSLQQQQHDWEEKQREQQAKTSKGTRLATTGGRAVDPKSSSKRNGGGPSEKSYMAKAAALPRGRQQQHHDEGDLKPPATRPATSTSTASVLQTTRATDSNMMVRLEHATTDQFGPFADNQQVHSMTGTLSAATSSATAHVNEAIPIRPGAYAIRGPGFDDSQTITSQRTIQIGEDTPISPQPEMTALDATVVTESEREQGPELDLTNENEQDLPPLVEGVVDKTCTLRDRRAQIVLVVVALVVIVAIVVGVVLGTSGGGGSSSDTTPAPSRPQEPTISPMPTIAPTSTESPTRSMAPSMSPTFMVTLDAGSISVSVGYPSVPLSYSQSGTRVAIVQESTSSATVYQQEEASGAWIQVGNVISQQDAASVSLAGNRIAVGSVSAGGSLSFTVQVLELMNDTWTLVGNAIKASANAWTVDLSQDGTVVAVESNNDVQVYSLDDSSNEWIPRGNAISIASSSSRSSQGRLNSGLVRVFGLVNNSWRQLGDDIIGDGQVGGFWGWSHALSQDGQAIVVMNNPSARSNQAILYRLEQVGASSSWKRVFDSSFPVSGFSNGALAMSADGNRVAIASQSTVQFFEVAGSTL